MEKIHIKLEHNEAILGKKQLLFTEANTLELLKRFNNFKDLRKRELILKNNFRKLLRSSISELTHLENDFPEEDDKEIGIRRKHRRKRTSPKKSQHQRNIESELHDIREQLAKLS